MSKKAAGLAVVLSLGTGAPGWASPSHTAYVASYGGSVSVVDTTAHQVTKTITGVDTATAIAIAPDGKTAYVAGGVSRTVTVIDTQTDSATATIPVGFVANGVAVAPGGGKVYVAGGDWGTPGQLAVIDASSRTLTATIPVGGDGTQGVAITPDGTKAYVTNRDSDTVSQIDISTATPSVTTTFATPNGTNSERGNPHAIAITPDGTTAFVTNSGTYTAFAFRTDTNQVTNGFLIVGSSPRGVAITPDGAAAYFVSDYTHTVPGLDTKTWAVLAQIDVGIRSYTAIAITPDGKTAYATDWSGLVSVLDLDAATATATIGLGGTPWAVAFTPNQPPAAALSATPARVGQPSSFDASASRDVDGTIASYRWDFGDGTAATTTSPTTTHVYTTAGTYTVTVTATDNEGCSASLQFTGQTVSCNGSKVATATRRIATAATSLQTVLQNLLLALGDLLGGGATNTVATASDLYEAGRVDAACRELADLVSKAERQSGNTLADRVIIGDAQRLRSRLGC